MVSTFPTVNQVAFATSVGLACATVGSVAGAVMAATKVAFVAYAALGITCGGASIASVTAWFDQTSDTTEKYFENLKGHAGIAIAGMYQFVAQVLLQALIEGLAQVVRQAVVDMFSGNRGEQRA